MKSLKLALTYLRIGIANEFQYRANFFIQILQSFIALAVGLIGLGLVFSQTTDLSGWSRSELLVVMGVYMVMGGLITSYIQPNMGRLMEEIQMGTLDYALTKPVDGQTIVSVREFRFWKLVDVVMGLVVLVVGVVQIQSQTGQPLQFNLLRLLPFISLLVMGFMMIYCFWMLLTATAFWIVRVHQIVNLFEGLYAAGRWPVGIYPSWLRYTLTFLVPVAFAVTVPSEALTGRLSPWTFVIALALTVVLMVLTRLVWKLGVRNYSGASA